MFISLPKIHMYCPIQCGGPPRPYIQPPWIVDRYFSDQFPYRNPMWVTSGNLLRSDVTCIARDQWAFARDAEVFHLGGDCPPRLVATSAMCSATNVRSHLCFLRANGSCSRRRRRTRCTYVYAVAQSNCFIGALRQFRARTSPIFAWLRQVHI